MRGLAVALVLTACCFGQSTGGAAPTASIASDSVDSNINRPGITDLRQVKRIYVASFGDDETSKQLQAMVVSSLVASKKFLVTENETKADAMLKGAVIQKTAQEVHAYGSGTAVGGAAGGHSASINGSGGSFSGNSSGGFVAKHMGIDDSSVNTETIDRASAAVRLVNSDGDVIWTSTQESHGAKYKGATADVADKIVSQLSRDLEKLSTPK